MTQVPSIVTREAGTSQPAGRSIRRRPSASHLIVALAVVLAFVLNLLALQGRGERVMVAVAADPIPAGAVLSADLLEMVPLDSEFDGLGSLLTETGVDAHIGWIVSREIAQGGVVDRSVLTRPAADSGMRAMSIPISVTRAAGGTVSVGDTVDVIAVVDGVPAYVVAGVAVTAVGGGGAGFSSVDHHVVVAVDADQALAIAGALAAGPVDVIRSTGAPPVGETSDDG